MISHFNKKQKRGIGFLLFIIILLQLLYYFLPAFYPVRNPADENAELQKIRRKTDSLQAVKRKLKDSIRPFNPSFISEYKAARLGLNAAQTRRLLAHRKAGKYINSPAEFQRVSGVSDSLLAVLKPYFKFPEWVLKKNKRQAGVKPVKPQATDEKPVSLQIRDINTATEEDFQQIRGIGKTLSRRIVKYRNKLKGYSFDDQLYEVWGLSKETAGEVLRHFRVIRKPDIPKVNINTARFKEVLHLPYMDYTLTKMLFDYRDEVAEIQSLEEIKKIKGFPVEKFERISLYLKAE